jgi:ankyrin repeat protein
MDYLQNSRSIRIGLFQARRWARIVVGIVAVLSATNEEGRTALQVAAINARKEVVQLLLSSNALVNVKDKRGGVSQVTTPKSSL